MKKITDSFKILVFISVSVRTNLNTLPLGQPMVVEEIKEYNSKTITILEKIHQIKHKTITKLQAIVLGPLAICWDVEFELKIKIPYLMKVTSNSLNSSAGHARVKYK